MSESTKELLYKKAEDYWSHIPATLDGVLGGFGFISDIDIEGSKKFLKTVFSFENPPLSDVALDCGAGIGRVSKYLLMPVFGKVDLVERDAKFLSSVKNFVGNDNQYKLGTLYNIGLQQFIPDKKYNIIWNQWVLGHLDDEDLISYLVRCRDALTLNGVIIVKENVTSSGKVELDELDSSVTRPLKDLLCIFKKARLKRLKQCKQTNFPKGIYPVYMFALRPDYNET